MPEINSLPFIDVQNEAGIRQSAKIIYKFSDQVTYFGFCKPGTENTNEEAWSILKIEEIPAIGWASENDPLPGNMVTFKWANGMFAYNLIWDNLQSYEYKFSNF